MAIRSSSRPTRRPVSWSVPQVMQIDMPWGTPLPQWTQRRALDRASAAETRRFDGPAILEEGRRVGGAWSRCRMAALGVSSAHQRKVERLAQVAF